jgi:hypothetical protein
MKKILVVIGAVVLAMGVAFAGGAALARTSHNGSASAAQRHALGHAQAPKARLVASVDPGGSVNRSKNVKSVSHPSTGIYCIKPKKRAHIKVNRIVPSVSVEWDNSSGNALMADWLIHPSGCPSGTIGVTTINGSDGSFDPDDNVAFTIVVP